MHFTCLIIICDPSYSLSSQRYSHPRAEKLCLEAKSTVELALHTQELPFKAVPLPPRSQTGLGTRARGQRRAEGSVRGRQSMSSLPIDPRSIDQPAEFVRRWLTSPPPSHASFGTVRPQNLSQGRRKWSVLYIATFELVVPVLAPNKVRVH